MRASAPVIIALLASLGLAGCSAAVTPTATPRPTASPTPSVTSTPAALPTVEDMLAALDTAAQDDRAPEVRMGVALTADQPQFLEDARATPIGQGDVRVACSSEKGGDVTIDVNIGTAEPVSFVAPCMRAPSSVTSQQQAFDFTSTYRFTVTSDSDATVAIGVVRGAPE